MTVAQGERANAFTLLTVLRTCQQRAPACEPGRSLRIDCLKVLDPRRGKWPLCQLPLCLSTWNADDTRAESEQK